MNAIVRQYLPPQHWDIGNNARFPGKRAKLTGTSGIVSGLMNKYISENKRENKNTFGEIIFHGEIPSYILSEISRRFPGSPAPGAESCLVVAGANIDVYAQSERGMLCAAQDIINLTGPDGFPEGFLYNYPVCPVRGVKLMLPGVSQIEDFKRFIDLLVRYKYNTLMLEVEGGMEYKRHPEINAAWLKYCAEVAENPSKGIEIKSKYGYAKNSIHDLNGCGDILAHAQVRELIDYCRERLLEVIPEEPTLSHCGWLLLAHKELAERKEDPYPDAYCPMNPASYELVFDVLDEIIEVFNPKRINIGHDEYYSFKLCDRCKNIPAPQLFADDINKIHGYLKKKGVQTMMWGDKLLDAHFRDGTPCGGAKNDKFDATYPAIDMIPKDLQILHWYYGIDRKLEQSYAERGFEVIYGNFSGPAFIEWKNRASAGNIRGAIISNWAATDFQILQRNTVLFDVVYTALFFWNRNHDDRRFEELRKMTFKELERCRRLGPGMAADELHIRHTTDHILRYRCFSLGVYRIDNSKFTLGHYELTYADGAIEKIPVICGLNINGRDVDWERIPNDNADLYDFDNRLFEVAYTTVPEKTDDGTWYHYRIANPRPGKKITQIKFVRAANFRNNVKFEVLSAGKTDKQIKIINAPPSIMPPWQDPIANGWNIAWPGLSGGVYMLVYCQKCPSKFDVRCIQWGSSEKAVVSAGLTLAATDRLPTRIEVEGMDNDKPEAALMEVLVNGKSIYNGKVPFLKNTWEWRSFDIPSGMLKPGRNIMEFRNVTGNCENQCMGWYMISGLRFTY